MRGILVSAVAVVLLEYSMVSAQTLTANVTLDDGVTTVVATTTATAWSPSTLLALVIQADRSTRDDCMTTRAGKGLFESGDRVFLSTKYLAWLGRGSLRGVWTLNPATQNFRHLRTGPEGCTWAHNELVPGSASPQGQSYFWDEHAPPVEHSMAFHVSPSWVGLGHEVAKAYTGGNWTTLFDALVIAEGVVYGNAARMTAGLSPGVYTTDVADGNDANGVQNWVDSEVGYIMRADDIRVIWRFKPAMLSINPYNTYFWLWLSYAQDNDGASCDPSGSDEWPGTIWGEPQSFDPRCNRGR